MLHEGGASKHGGVIEAIRGLRLNVSGEVEIQVVPDSTFYFEKPDNSVIASISGVIDFSYAGIAGECMLYVPKNPTSLLLESSDFYGELKTDLKALITINNCNNLESIKADNATSFLSQSSAGFVTLSVKNTPTVTIYDATSLTNLISDNAIAIFLSNCYSLEYFHAPKATYIEVEGNGMSSDAIYHALENAYILTQENGTEYGALFLDNNDVTINDSVISPLIGISYAAIAAYLTTSYNWTVTYNVTP